MNREETNRFLTEAMGLCWHSYAKYKHSCYFCGYEPKGAAGRQNDFFTADGFFVAWEWAQQQGWWPTFIMRQWGRGYCDPSTGVPYELRLVNRERFALALAEFLEGRVEG